MLSAQKRISIFISCMSGGGQRSMLNLAQGIAERGHAVDLVLARAEGPFLTEVPDLVRVVALKASRVLTSVPALVRYLRRERPEAMLSVLGYVNIIALCAHRLAAVQTRLLVNEQNTASQEAPNSAHWRGRQMPWLMRGFYPWADGIVTVSNGVGDDLTRLTGLPRERIQVIYNPGANR
jgi:hypothetical protein